MAWIDLCSSMIFVNFSKACGIGNVSSSDNLEINFYDSRHCISMRADPSQ